VFQTSFTINLFTEKLNRLLTDYKDIPSTMGESGKEIKTRTKPGSNSIIIIDLSS
jgi:hypothetical protein